MTWSLEKMFLIKFNFFKNVFFSLCLGRTKNLGQCFTETLPISGFLGLCVHVCWGDTYSKCRLLESVDLKDGVQVSGLLTCLPGDVYTHISLRISHLDLLPVLLVTWWLIPKWSRNIKAQSQNPETSSQHPSCDSKQGAPRTLCSSSVLKHWESPRSASFRTAGCALRNRSCPHLLCSY